jgi:hypothetical protein
MGKVSSGGKYFVGIEGQRAVFVDPFNKEVVGQVLYPAPISNFLFSPDGEVFVAFLYGLGERGAYKDYLVFGNCSTGEHLRTVELSGHRDHPGLIELTQLDWLHDGSVFMVSGLALVDGKTGKAFHMLQPQNFGKRWTIGLNHYAQASLGGIEVFPIPSASK